MQVIVCAIHRLPVKPAHSSKTNGAPLLKTTLGLSLSFCRLDSITRSECVAFLVGNGYDKPEVRVRDEIRVTALSGELALLARKTVAAQSRTARRSDSLETAGLY